MKGDATQEAKTLQRRRKSVATGGLSALARTGSKLPVPPAAKRIGGWISTGEGVLKDREIFQVHVAVVIEVA